MKKVTSIVIGAGLRGGHVYSQYALDHPDEFQVVAVAEPDKSAERALQKDTIFRKSFASKAMKSFLEKKSWQIVP